MQSESWQQDRWVVRLTCLEKSWWSSPGSNESILALNKFLQFWVLCIPIRLRDQAGGQCMLVMAILPAAYKRFVSQLAVNPFSCRDYYTATAGRHDMNSFIHSIC